MNTTEDQEETILHSLCGHTVVRVSNNLVVKSGHMRSQEAETLRFIITKTTIPVSKVYEIRWENGQDVAIMMDYVPGKRLDET